MSSPGAPRRGIHIELVERPDPGPAGALGPVSSVQEAVATVPGEMLAELWRSDQLMRISDAYWRYLERVSLGLLRVLDERDGRVISLVSGRLALIRFRRPRQMIGPSHATVSWPIERGVLVAREGRGRGHLSFSARREGELEGGEHAIRLAASVTNFYPLIRGSGALATIGARLYRATQLRLHVLISRGFLRSLERLDPPPAR